MKTVIKISGASYWGDNPIVSEHYLSVGDPVEENEAILSIVNDKVSIDVTSPTSGILDFILALDDTIAPKTILAVIKGDDFDTHIVAERKKIDTIATPLREKWQWEDASILIALYLNEDAISLTEFTKYIFFLECNSLPYSYFKEGLTRLLSSRIVREEENERKEKQWELESTCRKALDKLIKNKEPGTSFVQEGFAWLEEQEIRSDIELDLLEKEYLKSIEDSNMTDLDWVFSDAWILMSISLQKEGCSLPELIGVCDFLNHAIPTVEEVNSSINKLLACEVISNNEGLFKATTLFSEEFEGSYKIHGQMGIDQLKNTMNESLLRIQKPVVFSLSEEEFDHAYQAYRERF